MIKFLYVVYDSKSETYNTPFAEITDASAIRSFAGVCKNPDTILGQHPEDFTLFRIGHYNDQTSEITPQAPERLATGIDVTKENVFDIKEQSHA